MLIYTGLRIGELFSLRRENVHLKEGYLVGGSKTKAGKNRTVPILPEALSYLQYFWSMGEGDLLISGYKGNRTAKGISPKHLKRWELPARPHTAPAIPLPV